MGYKERRFLQVDLWRLSMLNDVTLIDLQTVDVPMN